MVVRFELMALYVDELEGLNLGPEVLLLVAEAIMTHV
jgi:hypothetical protein